MLRGDTTLSFPRGWRFSCALAYFARFNIFEGNKGLLIVYKRPSRLSFYQMTPLPLAQHWNSFSHVMSIVLSNELLLRYSTVFMWTIFQCHCRSGRSCSKCGWRYPSDKSLSSWLSIRETNCAIHWIEIYPVDSAIYLLNGACVLALFLVSFTNHFELSSSFLPQITTDDVRITTTLKGKSKCFFFRTT